MTNGDDDAPLAEPCPGGPRGLWHLEKLVGIAVVAVEKLKGGGESFVIQQPFHTATGEGSRYQFFQPPNTTGDLVRFPHLLWTFSFVGLEINIKAKSKYTFNKLL